MLLHNVRSFEIAGVCFFMLHHSHPKSGSFVRPSKVDGGITAVRAVNERYGLKNDAEAGVNKDELFVLDQFLNPIVVEMVGAKKVNMLQRLVSGYHLISQDYFIDRGVWL